MLELMAVHARIKISRTQTGEEQIGAHRKPIVHDIIILVLPVTEITVISVLIGVLVPVLGTVRKDVQKTTCASNMRQT